MRGGRFRAEHASERGEGEGSRVEGQLAASAGSAIPAVKPTTVFLGSGNAAKRRLMAWALAGVPVVAREPPDEAVLAVEEEGGSHREIALAKACAWSERLGGYAVASDGGVAIPALGARWSSLRTRRFSGPHPTLSQGKRDSGWDDAGLMRALLDLMAGLRDGERSAWWIEAVGLACRGAGVAVWEVTGPPGRIAEGPRPVRQTGLWLAALFVLPSGRSLAELDEAGLLAEEDNAWRRLRELVQADPCWGRLGSHSRTGEVYSAHEPSIS